MIGEHTDYNEGFVFPMCLEYGTFVVGFRTQGMTCKVYSEAMQGDVEFELSQVKDLASRDKGSWISYVCGTMAKFFEAAAPDAVSCGFCAIIGKAIYLVMSSV